MVNQYLDILALGRFKLTNVESEEELLTYKRPREIGLYLDDFNKILTTIVFDSSREEGNRFMFKTPNDITHSGPFFSGWRYSVKVEQFEDGRGFATLEEAINTIGSHLETFRP